MATLVTNVGFAEVTALLEASALNFVGWGTGAGTAAAADTTLFTEASEARVAGTQSVVTTTVASDTYQVVSTLVADGTKTITNAGIFDASTAGDLFLKGDFTGVALTVGESIQFTCKVQVS